MADFDSLMKGMQLFNQGMQKLTTARAFGQAQEEVSKLNSMEMDEQKKRQQMNMIAQNLSMQLAKGGGDPAVAENMMSRGMEGTKMAWQSKENALNRASEERRSQMAVDASLAKAQHTWDDKETKRVETAQGRFNQIAKKSLEALEQARTAKAILASNNPIGDSAIPTFMARATGEVGNLTEAERAPFGSAQDIQSRLNQIAKKYSEGILTDENRKYVSDLATVFEKSSMRAAGSYADRIAKQAHGLLPGRDLKEIRKNIFSDDLDEVKDPMLEAAKNWLADPKNKNHPKYEAVKKKLGL